MNELNIYIMQQRFHPKLCKSFSKGRVVLAGMIHCHCLNVELC